MSLIQEGPYYIKIYCRTGLPSESILQDFVCLTIPKEEISKIKKINENLAILKLFNYNPARKFMDLSNFKTYLAKTYELEWSSEDLNKNEKSLKKFNKGTFPNPSIVPFKPVSVSSINDQSRKNSDSSDSSTNSLISNCSANTNITNFDPYFVKSTIPPIYFNPYYPAPFPPPPPPPPPPPNELRTDQPIFEQIHKHPNHHKNLHQNNNHNRNNIKRSYSPMEKYNPIVNIPNTDLHFQIPENDKRLFFGNLNYLLTINDLKRLLRSFTPFNIEMPNGYTFKGYAIITFQTAEVAREVLAKFDGIILKGRKLNIRYDKFPGFETKNINNTSVFNFHNGLNEDLKEDLRENERARSLVNELLDKRKK